MIRFKNKPSTAALFIVFCTVILIWGCNGCQKQTQRPYDAVKVEPVKIHRFEKELFAVDINNLKTGLQTLSDKYGLFYFHYAHDMLAMPFNRDSLFIEPMQMLLGYKPFNKLQHTVDSFYNNVADLEKAFTAAMGIYKAQFPEKDIPTFISFISEFGYANVTFEKELGIGLDMYMNSIYSDVYRSLEFPEFMIRKLRREYIVPNTIKSLAIGQYEEQTTRDKRFLATMLFEGKVRYFTKALLPNVHDSLIMGYSAQQLKWCEENETQMWAYYASKDLFYKDEPSQFLRYFNDGPFTSADGVPPESAPAIGVWTGWKIIQAYMDKNPEVTLQQLMEDKDFDKILKQSRYNPK